MNIIYDQYHDRFHSFNSKVPTLLHIHREAREIGLKTYQLSFGTESFEPRIYFDFKRDILLFDEYLLSKHAPRVLRPTNETAYKTPLSFSEVCIRRRSCCSYPNQNPRTHESNICSPSLYCSIHSRLEKKTESGASESILHFIAIITSSRPRKKTLSSRMIRMLLAKCFRNILGLLSPGLQPSAS